MDLFGETTPPPADPEEENIDDMLSFEGQGSGENAESFAHPRLMFGPQGFDEIEKNLTYLFQNGRLPHGMIFAGQKGIGKSTMAFRLARYLFKYGAMDPNQNSLFGDAPQIPDSMDISPEDRAFKLVASGAHPDLLSLERAYDETKNTYKDSIAVAEVRKVNGFLHMTSSEGGWRVVIIDDADTMNRSAQNALLKILEEPPEKTLIILIAHRPGALIPTIRSRTRLINFPTPSYDVFAKILEPLNLERQEIETLYALSGGSIGSALASLESQELEVLAQILDVLGDAPNWDWTKIHTLSNEMGKSGEAYKSFARLMLWVFMQLARAKGRAEPLSISILAHPALQDRLRQASLESTLDAYDALQAHFIQADRGNLDKKQAVMLAFSLL
ncbi:MAG: DNA polymerase III subunit delta' [Alphaproteobacteria bacterium]|nr:DNA polymerase III subunit delta' [Alphaproteobacteria bacterium]